MNGWFVLLSSVTGWFIAQLWKTIVGLLRRHTDEKMSVSEFISYATRSGDMPSGHSACVAAMTTSIGLTAGFGTEIFALALVTSLIVIYDATHVRYAVGVQGKALNEILAKNGKKPLKVVEGHTMTQVIVGVIIGILTGVIMSLLLKA